MAQNLSKILIALMFFTLLVNANLSFAQSPSAGGGNERDKRRTTIDFEDELIQGEVKKPELLYLLQKKQFNFKRLIKLREHFKPEMRRTAEELHQVGSPD